MACCSEGRSCPMHESDSTDSKSVRVISQAEADSCCAASEDDKSSQSSSTFASTLSLAALGTPTILPRSPAGAGQRAAGSAIVPPPPSHVPKHVRLSVFLL